MSRDQRNTTLEYEIDLMRRTIAAQEADVVRQREQIAELLGALQAIIDRYMAGISLTGEDADIARAALAKAQP